MNLFPANSSIIKVKLAGIDKTPVLVIASKPSTIRKLPETRLHTVLNVQESPLMMFHGPVPGHEQLSAAAPPSTLKLLSEELKSVPPELSSTLMLT